MCGIFGVIAGWGSRACVDARSAQDFTRLLARRGPDGHGEWHDRHVTLAHRRLAVIDPSEAAAQPMRDPATGCVLVYNGELYNDAELRAQLREHQFTTTSDTETVLAALAAWGPNALARLRGMFALGFYDPRDRSLLLARDPLGIKPLYWTTGTVPGGGEQLAFASEIPALLALGWRAEAPDLVTVSAYLSTIRTTLGERTMYEGVRCVEPGGVVHVRASEGVLRLDSRRDALPPPGAVSDAGATREVITDSLRRHLRSDVPWCTLLSGGLDSTILTHLARPHANGLMTYCAGAAPGRAGDDLDFAAQAAGALGTRHQSVTVTREDFEARWPEMVGALGVPLSTPNEIAIYEVSRRLRADGHVVAITGEGADELFGGYDVPLRAAAEWAARPDRPDGGEAQLDESSWVPRHAKAALLNPGVLDACGHDEALGAWYRGAFAEAMTHAGDRGPLNAVLRFSRRVNLTGLLQRLDTATMLAGVEGRTPFADRHVALFAESLPMADRFDPAVPAPMGTKITLRRAFRDDVPASILQRAKASFPMPFQGWMLGLTGELRTSAFARDLFTTAAIELVAAKPESLWSFAWPMINLALWGRRWAGSPGPADLDPPAVKLGPALTA